MADYDDGDDSPGLPSYYSGVRALEEGNHEQAEASFIESLAVEEHFKTHARLAEVYRETGRVQAELAQLRAGYASNPRNDRLAVDLALALAVAGDLTEAREVLEGVLGRNQSYGPARRALEQLDT